MRVNTFTAAMIDATYALFDALEHDDLAQARTLCTRIATVAGWTGEKAVVRAADVLASILDDPVQAEAWRTCAVTLLARAVETCVPALPQTSALPQSLAPSALG